MGKSGDAVRGGVLAKVVIENALGGAYL